MMDNLFHYMTNFEFAYPWVLIALILPLVAWFVFRNKKQAKGFHWSNASMIGFSKSWRVALLSSLNFLRLLAFVALVIAAARPQLKFQFEESTSEGIDIVLCVDISSSMLAEDFKPNRLEVAKEVAINFVDKRAYDRLGLVLFAGESFTQIPRTLDQDMIKNALSQIEVGIIKDGTAIGMGLANSVNRLTDSDAESKVIILLTDGVNNSGQINPSTAIELAKKTGVKVYTIGVGTSGEAPIPISRRADGSYVYSMVKVEIDEALLRQIAEETGGKYFRATSAEMLAYIYSEIDKMEKSEVETAVITNKVEKYRFFVLFALVCLSLEFLISLVLVKRIQL